MAGTPGWLKDLIAGPIGSITRTANTLIVVVNDLKRLEAANKELQDKVIALQSQVDKQADVMLRMMESIDRLEDGLLDKIELQVRREADKHFKG
jgi:hypothetical protein